MIKINLFTPQNRRDAVVMVKMLSPLLFILAISANFHEFIVHAVEANLAINCGIIIAAAYGVVLIMARLVSAQMDFRVIERFGHEAAQGVYMKTLLEESWLKRRYVRHYLSHIANTGGTLSSQMDQSAIESELHALQGEYESKLELPQFLVGFMIAMGLLGTFIGLLETLTGISGMLDGMGGTGDVEGQFMKLVVELRKPLAGMGIAFSASMFGLVTSLMLAVMMTNLRRYISRVMALARNVMHELTEMSRGSGSSSSAKQLTPEEIATMARGKSGGEGGAGTLSTTMLAGRFELLSKKIELLLEAFEASIASTQKMTDMLGFGPRMKEISERTLEEIKGLSTRNGEQHKTLQHLIEVTVESGRTTAQLLDAQKQTREIGENSLAALKNLTLGMSEQHQLTREGVDVQSIVSRTVTAMLEAQKQTRELNDQTLSEMKKLNNAQEEQRKLTQNMIDVSAKTTYAAQDIVEAQKQSRVELSNLLENLAEKLTKLEESGSGSARHIWEIKENFTKLCKSLGVVDLIASGVGSQALLLETLVDEARGLQRVLVEMQQGGGSNSPPPDFV